MRNRSWEKEVLFLLLALSVCLYLFAPNEYSLSYCIYCFAIYIVSAIILLSNNIKSYRSVFLFEVLFSFSYLFVNYAYPVFIYSIDPYFSLFARGFNESVMTKCTALASIGFVSYCIGQFKEGKFSNTKTLGNRYWMSPVGIIDVTILSILLILFLIPNLTALRSGYTMEGAGGGFFFIFALFYIYKYFACSIGKTKAFVKFMLWGLIGLYIVLNFLLGNRGEPLYLCVAILYCYHVYVHKVSLAKFSLLAVIGLFVFYFVGVTRISSSQQGIQSRSERINDWEAEDNVLRYANELIINNRSLFVLVDYADEKGHSFGKTWSSNFFSMVPYGQSFALNVLGIPKKDFSSTHLTTYIEFGEGDPDAFGLGTNLIGDIYLCYGMIGVLILMFLFGKTIRIVYEKSRNRYSYYQMLYIIFIVLSVYYNRASLFSPMQMIAWTYALSYLSRIKK